MEKRKNRIVKLAVLVVLLMASMFGMPQKTFAEENDDVTLPTGDIKPMEPQQDEDGIDTYGADNGDEYSGTEYELYSVLEERVKKAMLAGESSVSVRDLKIKKDAYDLSYYYGYSPYFPSDTYGRIGAYYNDVYYTRLQITNTFGTPEETQEIFEQVDQKLASIYKLIDSSMTEDQKAVTIHDYLVSHAEYDLRYKNYTSYGVLMDRRGVCQSYALAYMYIMNHLGIETHLISSSSMNHAWNVVKIDGEYYNVDCTFDDPIYDRFGQARHTYLLRCTEEMEELGHTFDEKPYDCTSTEYSYEYWRNTVSPVYFWNGDAYYIKWGELYCYHISDGTEESLSETEEFTDTLAKKGNELYYCSDQNIYIYTLEWGGESEIYNHTEAGYQGELSGLRIEMNRLQWYVYFEDDGSSMLFSSDLGEDPVEDGWHQDENGRWFYYQNGSYLTGWQQIDKKWYLLGDDGVMKTGWQKVDNVWYYMNGSGVMKTGWQKIGGKWYYMNGSGAMKTGWQKISGKWYYMNGSGVMLTSWQKVGGKWYYMDADGVMQASKVIEGTYYVKADGAMAVSEWRKLDNSWYFFTGNGSMVKNGWKYIGGAWYYFKEGKMQENCWIDDSYVGADGKWVKDQVKTA